MWEGQASGAADASSLPVGRETHSMHGMLRDVDAVHFDEAAWRFLVVKSCTVSSFVPPWGPQAATAPPDAAEWMVSVPELASDPQKLLLRCSLPPINQPHQDAVVLGMLEGHSIIDFREVSTGNSFVQGALAEKPGACPPSILGFFWTPAANMACVLVTSAGLQMFRLGRQGLQHQPAAAAATPPNVCWYRYQHDTRLLLLGGQDQRDKIHIYQLTQSKGVTRLPPVSLTCVYSSPQAAQDQFRGDHVHLIRTHHNAIYLAILNPGAMLLHVWRLRADFADWVGVLRLPEVEILPGLQPPRRQRRVCTSVVDNLLVVHCLYCRQVLLYDLHLEPLAAPGGQPPCYEPLVRPLAWALAGGEGDGGGPEAADDWDAQAVFAPPNVVFDLQAELACRMTLDGIAVLRQSALPLASKFEVLSRRDKGLRGELKEQKLQLLRAVCQDRISVHGLRSLFDQINRDFKNVERELGPSGVPPPHIISPTDVINNVLLWMHNEEVVDAPYLQAAVSQFFVSAEVAGVAVPVTFDQLLIDTVLEQGHGFQADQMMVCLSPRWGSPAMWDHIQAAAAARCCEERLHAVTQLLSRHAATPSASEGAQAADAAASPRRDAFERYVRSTLAMGNVVSAVKAMMGHGKDRVAAQLVNAALESAGKVADDALFQSVYRCCDALVSPENF